MVKVMVIGLIVRIIQVQIESIIALVRLTASILHILQVDKKKWNSTSIVLIGESANYSSNFIHTYTDKNTSTNAAFYNYSSDSAGHLTKWSIKMNKAKMDKRTSAENQTTLAHEFGHVIGLNDLKQTQNKKYLMYGYSDRTVSSPTTTDKTGAKKALGL